MPAGTVGAMRQGSLIATALVALLVAAAPARASNDPLYPQQWGMAMVGADAAHQVTEGQGATIAVVDTGANFSHPDLAGRLIAGHDFVDGDDNPTDEDATDHHGTHVSGIVSADANNGVGVEGVAPQAHVLVVRALDAGIVVVAAAGNDTLPFCEQPSSLHGPFMCVAAVDRQGQRAFYSSFSGFGSGYAISAPGGSGNGGSED